MNTPEPATDSLLVDAAFVHAYREQLVLCDVRWYLDGRSGQEAYERGHLPGAVFVDLDRDLSDPPDATRGRHPFPAPAAFAGALGKLGIEESSMVVAYDDSGGGTAGRLVWMLHVIGQRAAVLDGGLAVWDSDLEVGPGAPRRPVERRIVHWPASVQISADQLVDLAPGLTLLDARAKERFRGVLEPTGAVPGHIPGARNLPWTDLLEEATGRYANPDELRIRFASRGVHDASAVIASCGSGVTACALLVGMHQAGLGDGQLFVDSYSGWSGAHRSIATGDPDNF